MKKTNGKKWLSLLALSFVGAFAFASCQNFEDLVPEEYGAWENNYIYRGNIRSKTTGENGETLVSNVDYDGVTYGVNTCTDYEFVGDNIYMLLSLTSSVDWTGKNALVRYDVKEKTQEVTSFAVTVDAESDLGGTWTYAPLSIERVFEEEEKIILYGSRNHDYETDGLKNTSYSYLYYTINFDGEIVGEETLDFSRYVRASDDYFYQGNNVEDGKLSYEYVTWGMSEGKNFYEFAPTTESYSQLQFVEKNGAKGFLISEYERGEVYHRLQALKFYDLASNQTISLFEGNALVIWVETPNWEYFMTYENSDVTYTQRDGMFGPTNEQKTTVRKNCVLYKIEYSANATTAKKAFEGNADKDYTFFAGVVEDVFYTRAFWYENAGGCKGGGRYQANYAINLKTGKEKKVRDDNYSDMQDECYGYYARQNGAACGDYSYYIQREELTSIGNVQNYAYLLKRYNKSDKKTDVMQLWKGGSSHEQEKYCQQMWKGSQGGNIYDFIVRNY
ncbi:MAG: hypothetical protein IKZ28_05865 [Clostridia bacterium]|nr:hypothetical protein [Clostridia bacterium]